MVFIDVIAKSDETSHQEPGVVPLGGSTTEPPIVELSDTERPNRDFDFYAHMAWSGFKQLVSSAPPIGAARQVAHNFQVVGTAASLADRGEWDLAATALLELPRQNAEAAARILTAPINAALAIPGAIDTALNSTDPEEAGAAGATAIQDIATVAMTVAAVAGGAKGKGGGGAADSRLPDSTVVCRGGTCTAERFANGSGVSVDGAGKLRASQ